MNKLNSVWGEILRNRATAVFGDNCKDSDFTGEAHGTIGSGMPPAPPVNKKLCFFLSTGYGYERFLHWEVRDVTVGFLGTDSKQTKAKVLRTTVFFNGFPDDPAGSAAEISFFKDGKMQAKRYYRKSLLQNPHKATPAESEFYENGVIMSAAWYVDHERCDSLYGHPAYVNYSRSGKIISAFSSVVGDLSICEANEWVAHAKKAQAAEICDPTQIVMARTRIPEKSVTCRGGR